MRKTLSELTTDLIQALDGCAPTSRIVSDIADALPAAYDQLAETGLADLDLSALDWAGAPIHEPSRVS